MYIFSSISLSLRRYFAVWIDLLPLYILVIGCEFYIINQNTNNDNNPLYAILQENIRLRFLIYSSLILFRDLKFYRIGKKLMKLKVIAYDEASEPKIWQLIVRNITIAYGLGLFDVLFMLSQKNNRRLGDVLAKTKVITCSASRT